MKRFVLLLAAVAVAFFGNIALAQEAAGIPEDIMEELDYFVGTWKSEGTMGGEKSTGAVTCRWARSENKRKACIIGRFSYKTGDEVRSGVTLIGWNAAKERIEDRGFDANGGNAILSWKIESPTHWQGEVTIVQDGQEVKGKADFVKKGQSEFVYEAELSNGELVRVVFRKSSGKGESTSVARKTTTRKDFREYCKAMEGRWVNSNELVASDWVDFGKEGEEVVSYGDIRIIADGNALEGEWYAGKGMGKWLTVWDPVSKQIKISCALSDGTVWQEIRYRDGDNWKCEVSLSHPDGTKDEIKSTLTISDDGKTHTYSSPIDDEPGVYHRVSK